ncbi:hypothetical protein [Flavobacterium sp.]|uniref:hypothetical protein n=1 Tax=Flavobacterium sp. TaxID=239 RepID=UPI00391D4758
MHTTKQSMQTATLLEVCYALRYNFFQDIANTLPIEFKANERPNAEKEAQEQENIALIAQLQEENKVLKIQNELLMKMNGMP